MKPLLIRTLTGILLITVVTVSILFSGKILFNLFLLFTCIALFEYRSLLSGRSINLSFFFYIAALFIYFIISYTELRNIITKEMLLLLILSLFLLLFAIEMFRKQENPFTNIAYSVVGIIWIVIPFALINRIPFMLSEGKYLLLSLFILVWIYDTLAYCIGSLIGKHRLIERISPKKSWEGAIGATILTMAIAFFMPKIFTVLSLTVIQWIVLAFIVVVAATIGDLVESLYKRQLLVKDSGFILPGHGGILDRFDSILFVIPLVTLYLTFIV
ncbi:MAG: phosphatidate cytidylyltransferase [Bacteroidales bacterium]|nr:phosphatidate cytidylyltransferase [Bacteroidales bacterium]